MPQEQQESTIVVGTLNLDAIRKARIEAGVDIEPLPGEHYSQTLQRNPLYHEAHEAVAGFFTDLGEFSAEQSTMIAAYARRCMRYYHPSLGITMEEFAKQGMTTPFRYHGEPEGTEGTNTVDRLLESDSFMGRTDEFSSAIASWAMTSLRAVATQHAPKE